MEKLARIFVILLALGAGALPFVWPVFTGGGSQAGTVVLHARMPQNGGWGVETISARVGEPLHLRLTSDDVVHSFSVAQMVMQPVTITPGEWQDVTLVFDRPGKYIYYCDRWCGSEHWRMRGTIEVSGGQPQGVPTAVSEPLYLALGIDVDAPHPAENVPPVKPMAENGAKLAAVLPENVLDEKTYRSSRPAGLWARLRNEPSLLQYSDGDLWATVAWLWQRQTTPAQLAAGQELFARECAACHGETGRGDGVMVRGLPEYSPHAVMSGHGKTRPPDLTDPRNTLGASPALLEGKLLRGGMGTGMPMWGNILSQPQLDALVSYLYTLVDYPPR